MVVDAAMLDAFVRISDQQGGPNSRAYWRDLTYKASVVSVETRSWRPVTDPSAWLNQMTARLARAD